MRILLFICLLAILPSTILAQVLGADLSYQHVNGEQYTVSLKVYYPCEEIEINEEEVVGVFEKEVMGPKKEYLLKLDSVSREEYTAMSVCANVKPHCFRVAYFTSDLSVMSIEGGHVLVWQLEDWKQAVWSNLEMGRDKGVHLTIDIPSAEGGSSNSSPVFKSHPSFYMCSGNELTLPIKMEDKDENDQIEFSLFTPFSGDSGHDESMGGTIPDSPDNPDTGEKMHSIKPPYAMTAYKKGFSGENPLGPGGKTNYTKEEGLKMSTNAAMGAYLVAVKAVDTRDGKKLSEAQRVFRIEIE